MAQRAVRGDSRIARASASPSPRVPPVSSSHLRVQWHYPQAKEFVPDLSEDPVLQQQRKSAWEAWQGTPVEPRESTALFSVSEGDGDGVGRNYKLLSARIERTLQFEKHAEYEIVTTYEAADGGSGVQESLVSRRYSEFRKLEKAISDVIEGLPVRIVL